MKIVCPSCSAQGTIDGTHLPAGGRQVTCPRCADRFHVSPERTGVEIIQQRDRMVCPKCAVEQPRAGICSACGIAISAYIQNREHERERERLDLSRLHSETRAVEAWYKELFDRRLITLVVRVVCLLFLLAFFMTCSYKGIQRNRQYMEQYEMINTVPKVSPETIDNDFRERFASVADRLAANTDACLSQNYDYSTSWYSHYQHHELTEFMRDNLNTINRRKGEAESAFRQLQAPSKKYSDCYRNLRALSDLHGEVCGLANAYSTHYPDFHDRLSTMTSELNKVMEEVNACKNAFR